MVELFPTNRAWQVRFRQTDAYELRKFLAAAPEPAKNDGHEYQSSFDKSN